MADVKFGSSGSGNWDFSGIDFDVRTPPSTQSGSVQSNGSNNWVGPQINSPATGIPHPRDRHTGMTHQPGLRQQPFDSQPTISDKSFTKTQNDFNSKYGDLVGKGNIDLEQNLRDTQNMDFGEWSSALTDPGKWDFKHNTGLKNQLQQAGVAVDQEEFGNFHFGMVAAARGYSLGQALFGAGAFQTVMQDGGSWTDLMTSLPSAFSDDVMARDYTMNGGTWGDVSYMANGAKTTDSLNILQGYDFYHAHFADKVPPLGADRPKLDVLEKFESYLPIAPATPPRTYFDKLLDDIIGPKTIAGVIGPELDRPYGPLKDYGVVPAVGAPLNQDMSMGSPIGPVDEPSMLEQAWDGITNVAKTSWGAVKDFAKGAWSGFKNFATEVWNGIGKDNDGNPLERGGFDSDYNQRRAGDFGIDWNDPQRQSKLDAAYRGEWGAMIDTVTTSISDFASDPVGSFKDAVNGISDTISSISDTVTDVAKDAWGGIKDALGFGDKKPSPPKKDEPGENNGGGEPNGGQVSGADAGVGHNDTPDSF